MVKLSSPSIIKYRSIIFQNWLKICIFPDDWKIGNIAPVHKKNCKEVVNSDLPVSLLPYVQKFLRSSYSIVFLIYFSCVNQLLSITHNIYLAFDANPSLEVQGVFLDLSKVFGIYLTKSGMKVFYTNLKTMG